MVLAVSYLHNLSFGGLTVICTGDEREISFVPLIYRGKEGWVGSHVMITLDDMQDEYFRQVERKNRHQAILRKEGAELLRACRESLRISHANPDSYVYTGEVSADGYIRKSLDSVSLKSDTLTFVLSVIINKSVMHHFVVSLMIEMCLRDGIVCIQVDGSGLFHLKGDDAGPERFSDVVDRIKSAAMEKIAETV